MDLDFQYGDQASKTTFESHEKRARSPHRIHYEAQVEVIRRQLGELEKIRENLGLSQRKICQLLMVDPSAWTRWTKKGEKAPPHIYRALQWYMIVQEKLPGLTPQYFVGKDPELLHQTALQKIQLESQKRQEFEEAAAVQTFQLEKRLQELSNLNETLLLSKMDLEKEVRGLKRSLSQAKWGSVAFISIFSAFLALLFYFVRI